MPLKTCVIDTSAVAAIFAAEADEGLFLDIIRQSDDRLIPASCIVEFCALHRLGGDRIKWIRAFLETLAIQVPPMTEEIAFHAASAFLRFGKGTGQRAQLNFGDCMSYAHAIHFGAPLLFKGDDFTFTDVVAALKT